MNVVEIPLEEIDEGDRLRSIDEDYARLIAASIEEEGQRTPIEVRKVPHKLSKTGRRYVLIAGGHRLRALQIAGQELALAFIRDVDDLQAKLLEIDENLVRRELSALDRATFLAERQAVYEELHPETRKGGDRKSDQNDKIGALIASFTEATAERLGVAPRSIQRAVARHKAIPADVRLSISSTWLADSGAQLDALVRLAPDMQRKVADVIRTMPGVRSVADAVREITRVPKSAPPSDVEKFMTLWRKAGSASRGKILRHVLDAVVEDWDVLWEEMDTGERARVLEVIQPELPGAVAREAA